MWKEVIEHGLAKIKQKIKVLKELVLLQMLSRRIDLTLSKCLQSVIQERARSNIETYLDIDIVIH